MFGIVEVLDSFDAPAELVGLERLEYNGAVVVKGFESAEKVFDVFCPEVADVLNCENVKIFERQEDVVQWFCR